VEEYQTFQREGGKEREGIKQEGGTGGGREGGEGGQERERERERDSDLLMRCTL